VLSLTRVVVRTYGYGVDEVFKALADRYRRRLLDALVREDGQSLGRLEAVLPELTRFGVMNHVRVLQVADLLTTRKVGRFKYHYLNPVPIQLVADRWISQYAAPFTKPIAHLKHTLETPMPRKPQHVYTTLVHATPQQIWEALTVGEMTSQYYFGGAVDSGWQPGERFAYRYPDGTVALEGEVLECSPPSWLVTTYQARWAPDVSQDPPSRVTYAIEAMGPAVTRLTVTHDGFEIETATFHQIGDGLPLVISGLKTLLETGRPLPVG